MQVRFLPRQPVCAAIFSHGRGRIDHAPVYETGRCGCDSRRPCQFSRQDGGEVVLATLITWRPAVQIRLLLPIQQSPRSVDRQHTALSRPRHGCETRRGCHFKNKSLALGSTVERRIDNPKVAGANPAGPTTFFHHTARWRSSQRGSLIRRRSRVRFPPELPIFPRCRIAAIAAHCKCAVLRGHRRCKSCRLDQFFGQ